VMRFLSYRIRKAAKRHDASYSFVFMRADGGQLSQIATLIDAGAIRPVIEGCGATIWMRDARQSR
jgi:hypothetical protein